jgi:hypothetical protein
MLFGLIDFGISAVTAYRFLSTFEVSRIPSFGFQENGTFHFDVASGHQIVINVLMMTSEELRKKTYSGIPFSASCGHSPPLIAVHNRTNQGNGSHFQWSGRIPSQAVYWPFFVTCTPSNTIFTVLATFTNSDFAIDYRDVDYSLMDLVLCIIYAIIAIIWIINSLFHPTFFIPLQMGFMLSSATKSVLMAFTAMRWEDKRVGLDSPNYWHDGLFIVHHGLFIGLLFLAVEGWGTFREHFSLVEILGPFLSGCCLVGGALFAVHSPLFELILMCVMLALLGLVILLQRAAATVVFLRRVIAVSSQLSGGPPPSVLLVLRFGVCILIASSGVLGCFFAIATLEFTDLQASLIVEAGILVIAVVEAALFMLRDFDNGQGVAWMRQVRILESPGERGLVVVTMDV